MDSDFCNAAWYLSIASREMNEHNRRRRMRNHTRWKEVDDVH